MDSDIKSNIDPIAISVLMPIYFPNILFFKKAIDSLNNQEFKTFELIIISDGHTAEIEQCLNNYPELNIKLLKNETRLGFQKSLNIGIKKANSNIIARMDSDDISLPDRFQKQFSMLSEDDRLALVGSNTYIIDENDEMIGQRSYPSSYKEITRSMLCYNPFAHSSVMFKKNVAIEFGCYDVNMMYVEDYDLWMRISSRYNSQNSEDFLVKIRNHTESIRGSNTQDMQFQALKIKKIGYRKYHYKFTLNVVRSFITSIAIICLPNYLTAIMFASFIKIGYFKKHGFLRLI
jgi:glycosyltransferase involved in cell wall biosynthesis